MSAHRAAAALLALLLSTGCSSTPTEEGDPPDASVSADAGSGGDAGATPDASVAEDAGSEPDAGEDGGSDAGPSGPLKPPTALTVPTLPTEALRGVALEGTRGTWEEEEFLAFSYQWLRCTTPAFNECAPIPEATLPAYVPSATDVGYHLAVRVTATNLLGAVQLLSNRSLAVRLPGPVNTVAPVLSGTARVGGTLTVDTGTWANAADATYATAWLRCEEVTLACAPIAGETGATYRPTRTDLGARIVAEVTATTSAGSVPARSAPAPIGHPECASVQTTAARLPGSTANVAGTVAWTGLERAGTLDGMAASAGPLLPGERTQRLVVTGFGFALPPGGVVQGIELELVGWSSAGAGVRLESVRLESPSVRATHVGTPEVWGTQPRTLRLGGTADTWNNQWTSEDISSPELAVILTVRHDGPGGVDSAHVDGVRLTVHHQSRRAVGPLYASRASQGSVAGRVSWENLSAAGPDDGSAATLTLAPQQQSQPLQLTGFGLPLPAGEVPRGVMVDLEASGTAGAWQARFQALQLVRGGAPLADNPLADEYGWADEAEPYSLGFGGALDTWHVPLTQGVVTDLTFGVGFSLINTSAEQTFTLGLHSVRMTAYYDVAINQSTREATTASAESNTIPWQSPDNIKARDGNLATANALSGDSSSERLTATGFGFTLPPSAIVQGVQVTVRRQTQVHSDSIRDSAVRLVSGGGPVGGNRSLGALWARLPTDVTYGGPADLWGREWTVAEVNDPSFGVALAARYASSAGNDRPSVDSVQLTVSYCVP